MAAQVYDKCESLFVAAEFMVAQNDPVRAGMAQQIVTHATDCQASGTCPVREACIQRFSNSRLDTLRALLAGPVIQLSDVRAARRNRASPPCALVDSAALHDGVADDDGNGVVRRRLDRATLARRESGLHALMQYWEKLAVAGPPHLNSFNPLELEKFGLIGKVSLMDVSRDEPTDYRILFQGNKRTIDGGADYRGLRIADYEVPLFAGAVLRDYLTAKVMGQPAYDQVAIFLPRSQLAYTRLILPFSSGGNRVTHLVVAFRTQPVDIAGEAGEHLLPVHET